MTPLFEDTTKQVTHEKRILEPGGFVQWREIYSNGRRGPWVFNVEGFCFDDIHCHVQTDSGISAKIPIDSKDRITINGKKYNRNNWNH